jgi:hypothetical protein
MQALAGITYIEIGGEKRPLKFGTNQTAKFCEIRAIDLNVYGQLLSEGMQDMGVIRDLLFTGLWAGAKAEKKNVDFDNFDIGDWMDEAGIEAVMLALTNALTPAIPNQAGPKAKKMEVVNP